MIRPPVRLRSNEVVTHLFKPSRKHELPREYREAVLRSVIERAQRPQAPPITQSYLEQLQHLDSRGHRVLSVYLEIPEDPRMRMELGALVEDLAREHGGQSEELEREVGLVQEFLRERQEWPGRGLALYSCQPVSFWQEYWLPVRMPNILRFDAKPAIRPLVAVLDDYERYAVLLVDTRQARLFSVFMGSIEEHLEFLDEDVIPKSKKGPPGRSETHYLMHQRWHLKRVVDKLDDFYERHPFDRLVVAGPEETTSTLRELLPDPLARRFAGSFEASMDDTAASILEETLAIEERLEREQELELIDELIVVASRGGRAVVGVDDTLEALLLTRVHKLVVAHGLQLSGWACPRDQYLSAKPIDRCPWCGTQMMAVDDLADRAIQKAIDLEGLVDVVGGEAADRLRKHGGMGAVLRF